MTALKIINHYIVANLTGAVYSAEDCCASSLKLWATEKVVLFIVWGGGSVCVCVREGGRAWRKEHRKKGFCNIRLIFDFIIVQSLCEQKDFYANFIVQTLQNQFLDWWSFQVIAGKITLTQVSFSDKSTFFFRDALVRTRHDHPLFTFY